MCKVRKVSMMLLTMASFTMASIFAGCAYDNSDDEECRCTSDQYCDNGTCVEKKIGGTLCTGNEACKSNTCAQGVCGCSTIVGCSEGLFCNKSANYVCESKFETGKSCESNDQCQGGLCDAGICKSKDEQCKCTSDQYCEQGTCFDKKIGGSTCSNNDACKSGICSQGACSCSNIISCVDGMYCKTKSNESICENKQRSGKSCENNDQCLSGNCDMGVCKGCTKSSDCAENQICDINACKSVVSCPGDSTKKCFLDMRLTPSEQMFTGTTVSLSDLVEGDVLSTTFTPMLSTESGAFRTCDSVLITPMVNTIVSGNAEAISKLTRENLISYLKSYDYAWELFYDYYIDIVADSAWEHISKMQNEVPFDINNCKTDNDKPLDYEQLAGYLLNVKTRDEAVTCLTDMFSKSRYVNANGINADEFWDSTISLLMEIMKLNSYTATFTREQINEMVLQMTLGIIQKNLATDSRFLGRYNPQCFEMFMGKPTVLTLINKGQWKDNDFYLVLNVSDSRIMATPNLSNNKYVFSLAPDYEVNVAENEAYKQSLTFPISKSNDLMEKTQKEIIARYEVAKCSNSNLIKDSRLSVIPTCESDAGNYRQFSFKSTYSDANNYSCESYFIETGRCSSNKCDMSSVAKESSECKATGYVVLNNISVYVELTDSDLK